MPCPTPCSDLARRLGGLWAHPSEKSCCCSVAAAAVGTLVSKTMLAAANAPYAAPAPGGTLISLDVFSLQVGSGLSAGGLLHWGSGC